MRLSNKKIRKTKLRRDNQNASFMRVIQTYIKNILPVLFEYTTKVDVNTNHNFPEIFSLFDKMILSSYQYFYCSKSSHSSFINLE